MVPYTFTATDAGSTALTGVTIADTQTAPSVNGWLGAITCVSLTPAPTACTTTGSTTLLAGQSATFTANYTVTALDLAHGSVGDSATATGPRRRGRPSPRRLPPCPSRSPP